MAQNKVSNSTSAASVSTIYLKIDFYFSRPTILLNGVTEALRFMAFQSMPIQGKKHQIDSSELIKNCSWMDLVIWNLLNVYPKTIFPFTSFFFSLTLSQNIYKMFCNLSLRNGCQISFQIRLMIQRFSFAHRKSLVDANIHRGIISLY